MLYYGLLNNSFVCARIRFLAGEEEEEEETLQVQQQLNNYGPFYTMYLIG